MRSLDAAASARAGSAEDPAAHGGASRADPASRRREPREEFDHEIANIYSEEATDCSRPPRLAACAGMPTARTRPQVAELQRSCIRSRAARAWRASRAMGDLSHELETLVIQSTRGAVAGDDHAHAVHAGEP